MVSRGENADQYKNRIGFYQVRRDHNAHLVERSMEEVADVPIKGSTEANAVTLEAVTED